jgi:hypothetical protein
MLTLVIAAPLALKHAKPRVAPLTDDTANEPGLVAVVGDHLERMAVTFANRT